MNLVAFGICVSPDVVLFKGTGRDGDRGSARCDAPEPNVHVQIRCQAACFEVLISKLRDFALNGDSKQ